VSERTKAIDLARGLIMILMVLDHARDFFSGFGQPTDLETTTPFLFFTRWITHFCAPGFVLLAGTAAFLYGRRHDARDRFRFLLTRGLWLVVLELTIVRFAWIPDPTYHWILFQVIWAIGWSMVVLAPLSLLPSRFIAAFGALMVLFHDFLDPIAASSFGDSALWWGIVHEQGTYEIIGDRTLIVSYPLVPWIGVMALGYGLGEIVVRPDRRRLLFNLGLGLTLGFVALRATNLYGDPTPWSEQKDALFTVMSFLNCEKYPPSLAFLLMTLGPLLLLLAAFDRFALPRWIESPLEVFGRVPLFFYVTHLYLLRIVAVMFAYARFGASAFMPPPDGHAGSPEYPLVAAYLAWLGALLVLYPACRAFGRFKQRHASSWWASYV
jgi:uncharacterized membrane protein